MPTRNQRILQAAVAAAYALLNGEGDIDTAHHLVAGVIETWAAADHTDDALLMEALQTLLFVCLWALRPELWESFHAALSRFAPRIPATLYLEVQTIADPVRTAGDVRLACCLCAVGSHGPRSRPPFAPGATPRQPRTWPPCARPGLLRSLRGSRS